MDDQEQKDLSAFEGNAQGFRIATRTQWSGTEYGLNLTSATLSALIKYPCASFEATKHGPKALKKFGYFKADQGTYELVREKTGLSGHVRHPLTFMMEAADDIAYATGDLEDVLKKGLVSYEEIRAILRNNSDEFAKDMVKEYLDNVYKQLGGIVKDKKERQQISLQRFCQAAVRQMTKSAIEYFLEKSEEIVAGTFDGSIVEMNGRKARGMKLASLCTALKKVMEAGVYSHLEIITREQPTKKVIHSLLDAIDAELFENPKGALAGKVYSLAPSNPCDRNDVSENYTRAMRMTDYVSGMTDTFAFAEYQRISGMRTSL
jgi:dGTPase